jgi:hypothetical protein
MTSSSQPIRSYQTMPYPSGELYIARQFSSLLYAGWSTSRGTKLLQPRYNQRQHLYFCQYYFSEPELTEALTTSHQDQLQTTRLAQATEGHPISIIRESNQYKQL